MAFYGCSSLTGILVPEGVTTIGEGAFYGCISLRGANLPAGATEIGADAFAQCGVDLLITVDPGTYAVTWCEENGHHHRFSRVGEFIIE